MNATVDPDLVKAVQQHAFALKNDVGTLAFEKEELRQQCQAVAAPKSSLVMRAFHFISAYLKTSSRYMFFGIQC